MEVWAANAPFSKRTHWRIFMSTTLLENINWLGVYRYHRR